jgi:hypothetical protein
MHTIDGRGACMTSRAAAEAARGEDIRTLLTQDLHLLSTRPTMAATFFTAARTAAAADCTDRRPIQREADPATSLRFRAPTGASGVR